VTTPVEGPSLAPSRGVAKRILVPVMPSERFYDAVVAAADLVAAEGGLITFLFTTVRPPPPAFDGHESQSESELEVAPERGDPDELDVWMADMREGLADARDLLYERGISDEQINHLFADMETPPAQAIADEAAAGGYDVVVLARGYFVSLPDYPGQGGRDVASAVQELGPDGVRLLVT
jgi:hypothetical protein